MYGPRNDEPPFTGGRFEALASVHEVFGSGNPSEERLGIYVLGPGSQNFVGGLDVVSFGAEPGVFVFWQALHMTILFSNYFHCRRLQPADLVVVCPQSVGNCSVERERKEEARKNLGINLVIDHAPLSCTS